MGKTCISKYKMSKSEEEKRMKCANKIPWSELNFNCLKETDKIVAKCLQCDKVLKNSAYDRLLGHK